MIPIAALFAASLLHATAAPPAGRAAGAPVALERNLWGTWRGGACMGDLTLKANGTFERRHYTPANRTRSGTWAVRWDALPPTLVLTCTVADHPGDIGTVQEVKVVQLDAASLAYQQAGATPPARYTRAEEVSGPPALTPSCPPGRLIPLTPPQRAFVEWYSTGSSAAEAYRKASGRDPGPTARNNGAQLLHKPHVRVAVAAALRDRNVGARCDREWKVRRLRAAIERCAADPRISAQAAVGTLVMQMAKLQGELPPRSGRRAFLPP